MAEHTHTGEHTPSHSHSHSTSHSTTHSTTHAPHAAVAPSPAAPSNTSSPSNPTAPAHVHSPSSAATAPASKAWMIGLVLVVLIGGVGFLIYQKLIISPPPVPVAGEDNRVQIKLLVDTQCTFCPQDNTILLKFDQSGITYDVQRIDAFSEEGKQLAQEFDINVVPAALISVKGLDQNAEVQFALQSLYRTKSGTVIFPESFLDGQPRTLTYLTTPTACSVEPNTIRIDAYLDYACKPCAEAHFILEKLQTDFNQLDVHVTPIQYRRFTQPQIDAALLNNTGALCAEQLGYFDSYSECAFLDTQLLGAIDENRMVSCLFQAGAKSKEKRDEFRACIEDTNKTMQNKLLENIRQSYEWKVPSKWTPAFIFDCKYSFVGHNALPVFLCQSHPELQGCEEIIEEAEQRALQDQNKQSPINIYIPDYNVRVITDTN